MYFPIEVTERINRVMHSAWSEGRDMLYEHEVYDILESIGLSVPGHIFIEDYSQSDEAALQKFLQAAVLKIVSPQIVHKQKVGGVKIVRNLQSTEELKKAVAGMKSEVLSHFDDNEKPVIKGVLLAEFVPFDQGLGYETLFGIKEDPAFGPVLTLSKGGDDAEFFAKYYDPANLLIPPVDEHQALDIVNSFNISRKFESIGHSEYSELMAATASRLSRLTFTYSYIAKEKPEYIIRTMDINPFVVTKGHRFMAVDGFAQFMPYDEKHAAVSQVTQDNLDRFFHPNGIAVIGVSSDMSKHSMGREIAHILHDLERDDLCFINAKGGSITFDEKEYPFYRDLKETGRDIDLVIYAAPAQFIIDFVNKLPENGPKAIVVISGIPANVRYDDFKKQMDSVMPAGTRVIGPNCIGVFHAPDEKGKGVNSIFLDKKRLEIKSSSSSNMALITQSGALAITVIDKMKVNRLFKTVVSFGNKYDVKITDLVAYFAKQDEIELISIYVEGLEPGEGRDFFELSESIDKPILVYKSGKTEAGARAAASHTASMSGSYDVFKAACTQAGVILAEKIEDYEDYMKAFSLLSGKIPGGNRVAGVLNAGFESTVGADELNNLTQAKLSEETIEKLGKIDRHGLVDLSSSFLDVTPSSDDRIFAEFVEALLQDKHVDCVFVANVPHSNALKSDPESCHDPDSLANLLSEMAKKYSKPIVVSINGGSYYHELTRMFEESGLPVYGDIRSAVKSLDRFVTYHIKKTKTEARMVKA